MGWCMGNDNQIIIMSNARSHLEKAISLNPEFAEAYYELGVLLKEENGRSRDSDPTPMGIREWGVLQRCDW